MIINKKVFNHIGLFDPRIGRQKGKLLSHEEYVLINKAKSIYKVAFVPRAVVLHSVSAKRLNLNYILRWRYYDGVAKHILAGQSVLETCKTCKNLFKTALLFLKPALMLDKKARIQYLTNLAFYIGKIV